MPKPEFGFACGSFSVALSGNGIVIPGSKNQPLRKSSLPTLAMNDVSGPYILEVECDGSVVCHLPVHVVWIAHATEPEPFLGFKSDNAEELRSALGVHAGRRLSLKFVPAHA